MRRKVTVLSGVVIRQRPRIDQDRLIPNPRSVLPTALDRVRRKLAGANDGDRQMVKILAAVLSDGLPASRPPATRRSPRMRKRPSRPRSRSPCRRRGAEARPRSGKMK